MRRSYAWGLGVLIVAAIVIYAVAHHSSYSSNKGSTSSYSSNSSSSKSTSSSNIILTKSNSSVGQYLTDGSGRTLYTYDQDKSGVSNVSGSLLSAWPAYTANSTHASLPAHVSTITRSDGTMQYTYNNMPLYYFAGEPAGQVTGDGVSGFHVAKPIAQSQSGSSTGSTGSSGTGSPY